MSVKNRKGVLIPEPILGVRSSGVSAPDPRVLDS